LCALWARAAAIVVSSRLSGPSFDRRR
jgi:hypothetical protein